MIKDNPNFVNNVNFSSSVAGELPFSVCWMSYSCKSNDDILTCKNHHHAFFELHFVTSGQMEYGADGRSFVVKAGEFAVIPPKCVHRVSSYSDDFAKFTVAFNLYSDSAMGEAFYKTCFRVCKMREELTCDVRRVVECARRRSRYRAELVELALNAVVLDVAEALFGVVWGQREESVDDRVIKAKMFIDDNCDVFFTCDEVAHYCLVSVKQLGRLFRKHENMGLLEYIHKQKTDTAKRMLAETRLSQTRIAELIGFSDARYFSKFFKRLTGETPAEYKKRIGK